LPLLRATTQAQGHRHQVGLVLLDGAESFFVPVVGCVHVHKGSRWCHTLGDMVLSFHALK
jgi:hypothetical protein